MTFLAPVAAFLGLTLPAIVALYFLRIRRPTRVVPALNLWPDQIRDRQANVPWQRLRFSWLLLLQLLAAAVLARNPFQTGATDGSKMLVLFLSEQPDPKLLEAHNPTKLAPEQIRVGERVIYQWCPDGILAAPKVSAFVEKHLKVAVTARNWNTATRLSVLMDEA